MPDPITGTRTSGTTYDDPTCDEKTGVCGARPDVSTEAETDCDRDPSHPPCLIPELSYRELARNMGARGVGDGPALDTLSWKGLHARMAALQKKLLRSGDYSGKDVDEAMLGKLEAEDQRRKSMAPPRPAPAPQPDAGRLAPRASAGVKDGSAQARAVALGSKDGSLEIGTVNGSVGANDELAGAAYRLKSSGPTGGGTVEVGSARASIGIHNADGSDGFHIAAQATIVSGERSVESKRDGSATGGLGAGAGFELSLGVRPDGELCERIGFGALILGSCMAAPGEVQATHEQAAGGKEGVR